MDAVYCLLLLLCYSAITAQSEQCVTFTSTKGDCIDVDDCPPILNLENLTQSTQEFLRKFQSLQCGLPEPTRNVCCPISDAVNQPEETTTLGFVQPVPRSIYDDTDDNENAMSNEECGVQYSLNRIYDGTITEIDEFPWMALLIYRSKIGPSLGCGGVLINKRYILTAAHCVTGPYAQNIGTLYSVLLGEHNTLTREDCDDSSIDKYCAPPPILNPIESIHPHPGFVADASYSYDDIALLKLANEVSFSQFVRPICLPTDEQTKLYDNPGTLLVICGWGKTENAEGSSVKLKANVPLVTLDSCKNPYQSRKGIPLLDTQICAGSGQADTCTGDSGGPLMLEDISDINKSRWYAIGVVSFNLQDCPSMGVPTVYTKTTSYLNWINSIVKL